jgi:hypothetical protein
MRSLRRPRRRWENVKVDERMQTGFFWLRMVTSEGLL